MDICKAFSHILLINSQKKQIRPGVRGAVLRASVFFSLRTGENAPDFILFSDKTIPYLCGQIRTIRRCGPCRASSPPAFSASSGANLPRKSSESVLSENSINGSAARPRRSNRPRNTPKSRRVFAVWRPDGPLVENERSSRRSAPAGSAGQPGRRRSCAG